MSKGVLVTLITFDLERDWRAREFPPEVEARKRGPDFPYSPEPSFSMIKKSVPRILDLLEKYRVRSIFFVTGEAAEQEPQLVKKIAKNHEIGVHTHPHCHPEFKGKHVNDTAKDNITLYPEDQIEKMIRRDHEQIVDLGINPKIFRSGKLDIDYKTLKIVKKLGLNDSSIELIGPRNFSNLWLYKKAMDLLEESSVTLNPAHIHDNKRFYPLHWIFNGCLILHPTVFGNVNIDKQKREDWFRRLEEFLKN